MRTNPFSYILIGLFCAVMAQAQGQSYTIKGIVKDAFNGQPISYANVAIWNSTQGAVTDSVGYFEITEVKPGNYRLQSTFIGYKSFVTAEFQVTNKDIYIPIELEESSQSIEEVNIVATPFRKTAESPLGLRIIGFKEIEKSAGGNRDISRVIQTFPVSPRRRLSATT